MKKFNPTTGTVIFDNTPFLSGNILFNFQQFKCYSAGMKWAVCEDNCFEALINNCRFVVKYNAEGQIFISVYNNGNEQLFINDISILFNPEQLSENLKTDEWMEYIHSFNFEGASGVKKVGLSNSYLNSNPSSSMVYLLHNPKQHKSYLFAACIPYCGDYISFKAIHSTTHLEGTFGISITSTQQRLIKPGQHATTTAIQCYCGDAPIQLLDDLGTHYKKEITLNTKETVTGWNSWDFYAGTVTSENIFDNHAQANKLLPGAIKYIIIDEGYEPKWGLWNANWKFPEGLNGFSTKITAAGGIPGIWTAALLVDINTDIYINNPEWFACDADGNISTKSFSYGTMAFLDPTHPEVEAFIEATFTRLKKDGFRYFKVDFTQEILNATNFYDRTVPRGELITRAFKIIRRAIGQDSYLLACGAPYESVIDIADACRTSGDIHNFWGHVLNNAAHISARWWMHRHLWNNDPDFLIVRSKETTTVDRQNRPYTPRPYDRKNFWFAGRELNLSEIKVYALLVYFSAGDIILSDNLSLLNDKGLEIIKKVLERPLQNAGVPVDIFKYHDALPSIWAAKENEFSVIGIFNWEEDAKHITIDLSLSGIDNITTITGFWDGKELPTDVNRMDITLQPRSCNAFIIK